MTFRVIILAAGMGTRMRSPLPKVLHPCAGRPLVRHVVEAVWPLVEEMAGSLYLVVGHEADQVAAAVPEAIPVRQEPQNGTGHAVEIAIAQMPPEQEDEIVLVLNGDMPLVRESTLRRMVQATDRAAGALLTSLLPVPHGYGRIVRDADGSFIRVVEEADASAEERGLNEVNVGLYGFRRGPLVEALRQLTDDNAQKEQYLPDVFPLLRKAQLPVTALVVEDPVEGWGVNDRHDLARAAKALSRRRVAELARAGQITLEDPDAAWLDTTVEVAGPVVLGAGSRITGRSHLSAGSRVDDAFLVDTVLLPGAIVGPRCLLTGAAVPRQRKDGAAILAVKTGEGVLPAKGGR